MSSLTGLTWGGVIVIFDQNSVPNGTLIDFIVTNIYD
jgi:hypothetical protein